MPGLPDESLLVDKVVDGEMPPKRSLGPGASGGGAGLGEGRGTLCERASEPATGRGGLVVVAAGPVDCTAANRHRSTADGVAGDWIKTPIDAFILAGSEWPRVGPRSGGRCGDADSPGDL